MLLPDGLVELEWCAAFSGPVRAALHALKYDGHRRVVEPLASALAERWQRAAMGGDVLTWVPVHRLRRRERGFDQAEDLCRALAARIGLPAEALLARRQRTVAQHALGRTARAGNVGGAFEVPPGKVASVAGRWVLVVDDVTTTGSTLAGCARALLGAGALAVSGLAVARER
jgi:ComF family protein